MDTSNSNQITTEQLWRMDEDERQTISPIHVVIFVLLVGIGFIVGAFGSISFPLGFGVNYFWTGIAVQQVGSIWFGGWGILAGMIFPVLSNGIAGTPLLVAAAYIPANAIQALLPAWAFRKYKGDPRLNSLRDYTILLAAMIISSAIGAVYSPLVVLRGFDLIPNETLPLYIWGWFGGNVVAGLALNFALLKALSPVVIRTTVFIKRWWV
ncbi:MAG: hypothetical protein JXA97_11675 [Anaerolineales bacterium]|nr:hypothetical protein [Anaerolineales bacterium]